LITASDLVVCMGGYNTVCETLCSKTMSLIIPRENPMKEQYLRAKAFHANNLIEYIKWDRLDAAELKKKILYMLKNKDKYTRSIRDFEMTGIARICDRISKLRDDINGGVR